MFEIFPEGGHWCARRADGLVCGLFRDRADAERFARLEGEPGQSGPSHADGKTGTLADPGLAMITRTG